MKTTRTCDSSPPDLPRKRELKGEFATFGLLNLLVAGLLILVFIGKATVPALRPFNPPPSKTAVTTNPYPNPGFYGRAPR